MAQKSLVESQAVHRGATAPVAGRGARRRPDGRWAEVVPGLVSWLVVLAPIWLTVLNAQAGIMFVTLVTLYFVVRVSRYGLQSLLNRRRVLGAVQRDWLADLQQLKERQWRHYRVTLLIRAFREGNREMLRETLESIYASNWPRDGKLLHNVEVVFATEEDDPITPPLVDEFSREFADRLVVRQIKHPETPGHLPGPSSAMNYAGWALYNEAVQSGFPPHYWLVADFDCDTQFHPQYLPSLVYYYATDRKRHRHVYQPVVLFTKGYWEAPLHSRMSAMGTSVLTLGWIRGPEIAFTGAAASLALLRSVDFWPTNSHSQDSGIELRLRLRYGADFKVIGLPVPLSVYPVMIVGRWQGRVEWARAYWRSFCTLFRQGARWREGPLDEFVESVALREPGLATYKLWNGLERDTLTLLPAVGPIAVNVVLWLLGRQNPGIHLAFVWPILSVVLSIGSVIGVSAIGQMLLTREFIHRKQGLRRGLLELLLFWITWSVYVPILSACAGLKTSTAYLLGQRPRGHYVPTPK